jgi:hypothetical protein
MVDHPMQRMDRKCACRRDVPVRLSRPILDAARQANLPPSTPVMSYHCRQCGIVSFRLEDFPTPMLRAA